MIDQSKLSTYLHELEHNTQAGVWELDIVNNVLAWSDYVFTLFEVDPEKFIPNVEFFLSSIHPDDQKLVNDAYKRSLETKEPYDIVHRLLLSDKRVKYVRERCRTEFDKDGIPLVSIGTVQDVTDIIAKENELRENEKTLLELSHMAILGELASGIAHEINNPLAILKGYHQMRVQGMGECPNCEYKGKLITFSNKEALAIDRISTVVSSLKSFSHVQKDSLDLDEILDICKEVESSVDFIKAVYEHNNIQVQLECKCSNLKIKGSSNILQQILMNIYSNAKDVLKEKEDAKLNISLSRQQQEVVLIIYDNGTGIAPDILPHIFKHRFTTKPKGVGTGYGLAFVKRSIEKMGGEVGVESSIGTGTTFTIKLPLIESVDKGKQQEDEGVVEQHSEHHCPEVLKCLVVDDEQDIAEYLCYILEELGHHSEFVLNGHDALEKVRQEHYDCLFTDIVMPEMSGQKLLRQLTQQKFKGKKIIVSGNFYAQGKSVSLNYDAHIEKPYTQEDIRKVLLSICS